jgi:hypothetical protein
MVPRWPNLATTFIQALLLEVSLLISEFMNFYAAYTKKKVLPRPLFFACYLWSPPLSCIARLLALCVSWRTRAAGVLTAACDG